MIVTIITEQKTRFTILFIRVYLNYKVTDRIDQSRKEDDLTPNKLHLSRSVDPPFWALSLPSLRGQAQGNTTAYKIELCVFIDK